MASASLQQSVFSHYSVLVTVLVLFLASCQVATPVLPTITPTLPPTATQTLIPSATPTSTITPLPSLTPEPEWYQPVNPSLGALKYQYAEVTNSKAKVYASLEDAVAANGNYGRLPNYPAYVAYDTSRMGENGSTYYLINYYGWMIAEDLRPVTPSAFTGLLITREIAFRFGWVLSDVESIDSAGGPVHEYKRFQVVHEVPATVSMPGYIAIGQDEWIDEASVALVDPRLPAEAGPNTCRFIYANLQSETLAVYNDCKLIFATLVASGKNSWTFTGRFAILNKWDYMPINSPDWSTSEYYFEAVPYFMSYAGDFGFHGNYWNDDFGSASSHGCINLSPADAKWLYDWAGLGERVIISKGNGR
jgi:lipoprotein-anchoring transpeptidase ErfK/SrfK